MTGQNNNNETRTLPNPFVCGLRGEVVGVSVFWGLLFSMALMRA